MANMIVVANVVKGFLAGTFPAEEGSNVIIDAMEPEDVSAVLKILPSGLVDELRVWAREGPKTDSEWECVYLLPRTSVPPDPVLEQEHKVRYRKVVERLRQEFELM